LPIVPLSEDQDGCLRGLASEIGEEEQVGVREESFVDERDIPLSPGCNLKEFLR
jgi:hypothetical protein